MAQGESSPLILLQQSLKENLPADNVDRLFSKKPRLAVKAIRQAILDLSSCDKLTILLNLKRQEIESTSEIAIVLSASDEYR